MGVTAQASLFACQEQKGGEGARMVGGWRAKS